MRRFAFRPVNMFGWVILGLVVLFASGRTQTTSWTLTWDKNPENDMYFYEIYRQVDGQNFEKIAEVYHPTVEYKDNTIKPGVLYRYKIKAVDANYNKSDFSETVGGAIPKISGLPSSLQLPADTTVSFLLDNYVQDPDHNDAELNWTASGYSRLTVQINNSTRQLTITTPANWQNSENVTLVVSDPDGWKDRWVITVRAQGATNQPPQIADIPNQTINEGQQFATIDLNKYVQDPDNDDSELTWRVTGNQQLKITIDNANIAHIQTPNNDWYGEETVTFIVEDPAGEQAQDVARFVVNPVNDPPVVQKIPDQTIKAGETFTPISLDDYVSDVDNSDEEMQWTVQGATKLKAVINANRQLVVTISDSRWSGRETLVLTVTDPHGASAQTQVVFTVLGIDNDQFYASISFKPDVNGKRLEIEWQTASPTRDNIQYGIVPDFTDAKTVDSVYTTTHRVVITDLETNVEYNFQITSQTENGSIYQSEVLYYTLDASNEVNVYPVPFVADENQNAPYIYFTNMPPQGNLFIYNLLGEPVFSHAIEGNSFAWDVRNSFGQDVQPGLYIYVVKNKDNQKVASGKLIVVK